VDEIKRLTIEQWDEVMALDQYAFRLQLSEREKEERRAKTKPEQMWGYFVDGKLAAKLTILPFNTWIGGKKFAMGGIAGVASWPEYRRKGMVGRLLSNALKTMKQDGRWVSFLSPFQIAFYRKYGWEVFTEFKKYEASVGKLSDTSSYSGRIERTHAAEWPLLQRVYEDYAVVYNGMLERNEERWVSSVFQGNKWSSAVYRNEREEPRGYIVYRIEGNHFQIKEWVCLDEQARQAILRFIANHDSMVEKVTWKAPADDDLPFLLSNPRIKQELVPHKMARIVDILPFLERYPFTPCGREIHFTLQVEDVYAEWNHGIFSVRVDAAGQASVSKDSAAQERKPDASVSCTIQTLSALLLGYRRADRLWRAGLLRGSREDALLLNEILPEQTSFCLDAF
jgi:predicted acetyltransferase